jgi:hypothetical protein
MRKDSCDTPSSRNHFGFFAWTIVIVEFSQEVAREIHANVEAFNLQKRARFVENWNTLEKKEQIK